MIQKTISDMRSKLQHALERIGKHNGHACPPSDSNIDTYLHDYLVGTDAVAYFTKTRKEAFERVEPLMEPDALDDAISGVTKSGIGENGVVLAKGGIYALTVDLSKPSSRFDQTKLRNALSKKGWDAADVEKLIKSCTKATAPRKTFKIVAADTVQL